MNPTCVPAAPCGTASIVQGTQAAYAERYESWENEVMLNKTDQARLGTLVRTAAQKGNPATQQQITTWMNSLKNKQWIPGTPWNIPNSQKEDIVAHFKKSVIHNNALAHGLKPAWQCQHSTCF